MIGVLSRLVGGLFFAWAVTASAWGAEPVTVELASGLPGKPGLTYLDLVKKVVPDLAADDKGGFKGHSVIEFRHIGGADMANGPPETVENPTVRALPVHSAGHERLLLMVDLGNNGDSVGGVVALALYDISGEPRLLDVADVAYDRFTSFFEPATVDTGGTDIAVVESVHFNSSQSYAITPLILIRDDRLELIDEIGTFGDAYCNYQRNETLDLKALPAKGGAFAPIAATVTETTELTGETCDGEPVVEAGTRTVKVTYNWNAAASRYEPDSDAFEKLAAENEERF